MLQVKKVLAAIVVFSFLLPAAALAQTTPYILTDFPISTVRLDTAVLIKWAGATRFPTNPLMIPDSGRVYYSKFPGGSAIANYRDSITKRVIDTIISGKDTSIIAQNNILFPGIPPQRGIKFRPSENGMDPGRYYVIVAWKTKIGLKDTVFFSNEIQVIVEARSAPELVAPGNNELVANMTPTFQWTRVTGVPYYHVIVSDEEIKPDLVNNSITGLSIIWEAISTNTSLPYGAPDPSGTISASPPPLSPGKIYSWIVLNNYGNHPAYSSTRVFSLPSKFTIKGEPLKKPKNLWLYPETIDTPTVIFRWTNLDKKANTYMVYSYIGSNLDKIGAQIVVWSTEVTAGQFTNDTGSVTLNAKAVLTKNRYTWKVIAIDTKGAGTAGDTTGFLYTTPSGTVVVNTNEKIISGTSQITKPVGLVKIQVEVLDGSLEAPLLFYTDNNGILSRVRPAGSYRLTATKDGFESQSKSFTLKNLQTVTTEFVMKRPDATIYGKVQDEAKQPVNLAEVTAVSERGDTVRAETDPLGSFILTCFQADWIIYAGKAGYITSFTVDTSVLYGQNISLNTPFTLKKNPYIFSGIVKNESGNPLLGVDVQVLRSGIVIGEIPSTGQNGAFSFEVESGTYTLVTSKVGFVTYKTTVEMLSSKLMTVVMPAGAALITGSILGKSFNSSNVAVFAAIPNAALTLIDTVAPFDTVTTTSDAVYGSFGVSVNGGKVYRIYASANGYKSRPAPVILGTVGGKTHTITDTLMALATLKGNLRISDSASKVLGNVLVSLIDSGTGLVVASVKSDALGTFEMGKIPDGYRYTLSAGTGGFVQDSTVLKDVKGQSSLGTKIWVKNGRVFVPASDTVLLMATITLKHGTRAIQWRIKQSAFSTGFLTTATVKIKTPLIKSIAEGEVVGGVGIGAYVINVDPGIKTLLDCSYHKYGITDMSDSLSIDTLVLPAYFKADTVQNQIQGLVSCTVTVADALLSSGYLFFKDINEQVFDSVTYSAPTQNGTNYTYIFRVKPHKDGSYMVYYFKLIWRGNSYGSLQNAFRCYINPDATLLTRLEITPYKGDTLLLPADADMSFDFGGFYGSNFIATKQLTAANVSWSFVNPAGCSFTKQEKEVTFHTGSGGSDAGIGILRAKFNRAGGFTMAQNVDSVLNVYFKVSAYKLDSIWVRRIDPDARGYITTSSLSKAEFSAEGVDKKGNQVMVSPQWKMAPVIAGSLAGGVFRPAHNFFGRAGFTITAGKVIGSYTDPNVKVSGLSVHFLMTSQGDTVISGLGCTMILPPGIVDVSKKAELSLELPVLKNQVFQGSTLDSTMGDPTTGTFELVGSIYDITDPDSAITVSAGTTDSIQLTLAIPAEYQSKASGSTDRYFIAEWNAKKMEWFPVKKVTIANDGSTISIKTTHCSRYAVVKRPGAQSAEVEISPNPFSPFVLPSAEYGANAQRGTLITVKTETKSQKVTLDIYNVVSDKVWSVLIENPSQQIKIWWDGKTTVRAIALDERIHKIEKENFVTYKVDGNVPCRNGRYFLVVGVADSKGKIKRYMKQMVLFK
jgi:hypothetical protein